MFCFRVCVFLFWACRVLWSCEICILPKCKTQMVLKTKGKKTIVDYTAVGALWVLKPESCGNETAIGFQGFFG